MPALLSGATAPSQWRSSGYGQLMTVRLPELVNAKIEAIASLWKEKATELLVA